MKIGVPKEIKDNEFRVGLTPAATRELVSRGHGVFIQQNAGEAIGLHDELYAKAGAKILRPPFDVDDVGRIAILVDPSGAAMGWMTPVARG